MKKLYLFLLAVSLISLACEKEKAPKQECGEVEVSQDEHIKMQVLPEKVSVSSLFVLKIENLTKEDVLYDAAFSLEYFNENEWQSIQLGITFEDVGYVLKAGKTAEEQLDLPAEKYSLKAGKYRINKTVTVVNHKSYKLCAEFEIQQEECASFTQIGKGILSGSENIPQPYHIVKIPVSTKRVEFVNA